MSEWRAFARKQTSGIIIGVTNGETCFWGDTLQPDFTDRQLSVAVAKAEAQGKEHDEDKAALVGAVERVKAAGIPMGTDPRDEDDLERHGLPVGDPQQDTEIMWVEKPRIPPPPIERKRIRKGG